MVNYHNPAQVANDHAAGVRIAAVSAGIFLWEFFIALNYDWDVIRGRLPYRWTIWIYLTARLTGLMAVIMALLVNMGGLTNCQLLISLCFIFADLAFAFSSLLILIRISPIWNQDKLVVSLATGVWLTDVAFLISGAARIRSSVSDGRCAIMNIQSSKPTFISMLATDITLLLIMLVGLFRLRTPGGGWLDLGRRLWKQGVIWLLLVTIAGLLPVVFLGLNLNDAFSTMFLQPTLVTMTIAATRMYRSLVNFYYTDDLGRRNGSHTPRANSVRHTYDQQEVTDRTTHNREQSPAPVRRKGASFANAEGQERGEPLEPTLREDAENNV